jgi:hypothetical protein
MTIAIPPLGFWYGGPKNKTLFEIVFSIILQQKINFTA